MGPISRKRRKLKRPSRLVGSCEGADLVGINPSLTVVCGMTWDDFSLAVVSLVSGDDVATRSLFPALVNKIKGAFRDRDSVRSTTYPSAD